MSSATSPSRQEFVMRLPHVFLDIHFLGAWPGVLGNWSTSVVLESVHWPSSPLELVWGLSQLQESKALNCRPQEHWMGQLVTNEK